MPDPNDPSAGHEAETDAQYQDLTTPAEPTPRPRPKQILPGYDLGEEDVEATVDVESADGSLGGVDPAGPVANDPEASPGPRPDAEPPANRQAPSPQADHDEAADGRGRGSRSRGRGRGRSGRGKASDDASESSEDSAVAHPPAAADTQQPGEERGTASAPRVDADDATRAEDAAVEPDQESEPANEPGPEPAPASQAAEADSGEPATVRRQGRRRGRGNPADAYAAAHAPDGTQRSAERVMLINYAAGEECRIAVVEDGRLDAFFYERDSVESHVSNIYEGVITNVEPAIQAAFVDFGLEQNGFLHVSDIHPKYFPGSDGSAAEQIGHKTGRKDRPPVEKCFRRGDRVTVQVLKEGLGNKGPTVTSYLSIPGRFLVMMPDTESLGVTRKVEDEDARRRAKQMLKEIDPPKDFGFIVRTAGIGQTKTDIKRDLAYLVRLWKGVQKKRKSIRRTGELYAESDLVIRTLRDVFTPDISRVICDEPASAQRARDFLAVAAPRGKTKVEYYGDAVPLFHRFGVEHQIRNIESREVPLPSGGALVIDPTEALVAIDVNSGKSRRAKDAETNAYQTNQEAVDEIARQLRLRDLGGLVVLDLIDMMQAKHRRSIEQRFKALLKNDRSRTRVGSISQFGMLEMTRQRMRPSFRKSIFRDCVHCDARGYTRSRESVVLDVMRRLRLVLQRADVAAIELTVSPDVAFPLLNDRRGDIARLEERFGKRVLFRVGGQQVDFLQIHATDARGTAVAGDIENDPRTLSPLNEDGLIELGVHEPPPAAADDQPLSEQPPAVSIEELKAKPAALDDAGDLDIELERETGRAKRKRSRGRGNRSGETVSGSRGETEQQARPDHEGAGHAAEPPADPDAAPDAEPEAGISDEAGAESGKKKRRRRRGRRGRGRVEGEPAADNQASPQNAGPDVAEADSAPAASPSNRDQEAGNPQPLPPDSDPKAASEAEPAKKRRRPRRSRKKTAADTGGEGSAHSEPADDAPQVEPGGFGEADPATVATVTKKKSTRRRRSSRKAKADAPSGPETESSQAAPEPAGE